MSIRMRLPTVKVEAKDSTGSGTIIHSSSEDTFVLTNWHVVDSNISFRFRKKRRAAHSKSGKTTARERWEVTRLPLTVHAFDFKPEITPLKSHEYKADIVACDKRQDLALLRLRTSRVFSDVALLAERDIRYFLHEPVWAVGCPSDAYPFCTEGHCENREDGRLFSTALTHKGSSGGGLYRFANDRYELIAVTTEIGGTDEPVSHMTFSIPIRDVYKFLERNGFRSILKANRNHNVETPST